MGIFSWYGLKNQSDEAITSMQSQKHFVRKVKEVKFLKMCVKVSQNSGLESQKSQTLTHGTEES